MKTLSSLLLSAAFVLPVWGDVAPQQVKIDILPGEERNLFDPAGPGTVAVAILGSDTLDVESILPESLRLAGAAIVKDAKGETHVLGDVNDDGRRDLVVQFSSRELYVSDADLFAVLEGRTAGGAVVSGRDAIRTLSSALPPTEETSDEKLSPLSVDVRILPGEEAPGVSSVAILGSKSLDPQSLSLRSIRINGSPITKGATADLVSWEDVNADGHTDLVVSVGKSAVESGKAALAATTAKGRLVRSEGAGEALPKGEPDPPGLPDSPEKARYPFIVTIPDAGPASPYPATIQVSGVQGVVSKIRVTLNGIVHTCFNDLDVLLVAPNGQSLVLMSDVGGCGAPANATDLTFDDFAAGTLSSGVAAPSKGTFRPFNNTAGDPFPAPAPAASGTTALSAFNGIDPNGDWKLYLVDDAGGDSGQMRDGWTLDLVTMLHVCNTAPLDLPGGAPGVTSGPASLYPSPISISGLTGLVIKVSVTLDGLTHTRPDDLDVLLVTPGGQRVMLASDAGDVFPVANLQLTLDDDAATYLPDAAAIPSSGTYRLADYQSNDVLPAPAPPGLYGLQLNGIDGIDPNGTWSLYVADDTAAEVGALSRGWCLNVTTIAPAESCQPFSVTIPGGAPAVTSGPASTYPVTMYVTGTTGIVQKAEVRLQGLSHTYPDDLDILLEAPSGTKVPMMSDAGGSADIANLDVRIVTGAGLPPIPDNGPLGSGPYGPSDYEPGESLPAPAPAQPYNGTFLLEPPNGDWKLWMADDAGADWGTMAGGWCLSLTLVEPQFVYCTTTSTLTIPWNAPSGTSGVAFPYPWGRSIAEEGTTIGKVQVQINGLSHTCPADLNVLLVGPQGKKVMLMSDAGGCGDLANATFTFDDEAATFLSEAGQLVSGTYKPSNYDDSGEDVFPPNAPAGPYGAQLSAFRGLDLKGSWELFVVDDAAQDVGSASTWCLHVFPLYPAGEATNLRWKSSPVKNAAEWDGAANATEYRILRGSPWDLPGLPTGAPDGCTAITEPQQGTASLTTLPVPGSFYWYLVVGVSGNVPGPAGQARIAGIETARSAEPTGACVSP